MKKRKPEENKVEDNLSNIKNEKIEKNKKDLKITLKKKKDFDKNTKRSMKKQDGVK